MSTDRALTVAETIESLGLVKQFQSICDAYHEGKKIERSKVQTLIDLKVVQYDRGYAHATHFGYTVSTRLIVRAAQRKPLPAGHWRT